MLTLGIETSCDETGAAVTNGGKVLANIVTSSVHLHKKYGGVVPEIASRYHVEYVIEVLHKALEKSGKRLRDVKLVSVTNGPGLVGALLVGISLAKALSLSLEIPIIGVNHILAHLYSSFLNDPDKRPDFPFIGLVVSGGHTALFYCEDVDKQSLLGQTQDDAVGEAFDKVAKILGLGYPGGPVIERHALRASTVSDINFPKSYLGKDSLDFSFSGIKTAVLYHVQKIRNTQCAIRNTEYAIPNTDINDICYAFQESALDVLIDKAFLAAKRYNINRIVVGGGVAANGRLRDKFKTLSCLHGFKTYFPALAYCMDNAAMIGYLGEELYKKGFRSDLYLSAQPNLEVVTC